MEVSIVNYNSLDSWLSEKPVNTVDTPYEIKVVSLPSSGSDIEFILKNNPNKYVDLRSTNISGSQDYCNFNDCLTLVGAPKCHSASSKPSFQRCSNLKYVESISYDNFENTFKDCISLIDAGTLYNARWNGSSYNHGTSMVSTFEGCTNLKSVIINDTTNAFRNLTNTFKGCSNLETPPVLSTGITNMDSTFYGCSSLTTAPIIPDTVTNMDSTFYGCSSLEEMANVPASVTSMNNTYDSCYDLSYKRILPSTVTSSVNVYRNVPTKYWRGLDSQVNTWIILGFKHKKMNLNCMLKILIDTSTVLIYLT